MLCGSSRASYRKTLSRTPFHSCFGLKQFSFRNRDLGNVGSSVIQPPSIPPFLIRGSDYNDSSGKINETNTAIHLLLTLN